MKKITTLFILTSILSCSPFHRMLVSPDSRNNLLEDPCDLMMITQLKQAIDSTGYDRSLDQDLLMKDLMEDPECEYYSRSLFPFMHEDSSIWLMTIQPAIAGDDEIILGNLYTFDPNQGSTFTFYRRVKEYSQKEEFESGKYVVFTYFVEDDNTTIVKAGKKKF